MQIPSEEPLITSEEQLLQLFLSMEKKCIAIENYESVDMKNEQIIENFLFIQRCIQNMNIFSENQKLTDIQTENLRYICVPYHIGYLYGKISKPRKQSILASKNYLNAFLNLCELFNCEDEQIFPKNVRKTWKNLNSVQMYKPTRDELVANMKQKKQIETRYENSMKIKDPSQQRDSIKDYIKLQIYESITQIKMIVEELQILKYKEGIEKDDKLREKHEEQMEKPLPQMKVWQIKSPEEILNADILAQIPKTAMSKKQELVAQVWQQNANKPTMTLEEVAQLEQDNMMQRQKRQQAQRQANKVDTDSDKEENDDREKKKARQWDDWKDDHEKGAGNRNKSYR